MDTRELMGRQQGRNPEHLTISITTTSIVNTTFSTYAAFARAYSAAPNVLGVNSDKPGAPVNATVTTAGITLYIRGTSPTTLTDGTAVVTASIEGKLA